jgi:hypothetical protein
MSGLHILDFNGAFPRVRDAIVAETRTFRSDFATTVYESSRMLTDAVGVLALLAKTGQEFAVIPLLEDIQTVRDEGDNALRTRRYFVRLPMAQWKHGKTAEGLFGSRYEAIENGWSTKDTFTVDIDGAGLMAEFTVAVETVEPIVAATNANNEVLGHTGTKRVVLEVQGCAS